MPRGPHSNKVLCVDVSRELAAFGGSSGTMHTPGRAADSQKNAVTARQLLRAAFKPRLRHTGAVYF